MSVGNHAALGSPESMAESVNYEYVERRAWAIMIVSFVAYCVLAVAMIYSVRWLMFESETSQEATVSLVSGSVVYTPPGESQGRTISQEASSLAEGTRVEIGSGSQATVSFQAPDVPGAESELGEMQVYGGSSITLDVFRSPRFAWGQRPHRMVITMQRGRARVRLPVDVQRQIIILLQTPHGEVLLERTGSYTIEVTNQATEVVVREGAATVTGAGQRVILAPNERTLVRSGDSPEGVLTGERNLLLNGDFASPLSPSDWSASQDRNDPLDVLGNVELTVDSGRNTVRFTRLGRDWGRLSMVQRINRDVRDYVSLSLHLAVKIVRQNLLVCGGLGSECPMMVKIEYTDAAGGRNEWLQGFYFLGDSSRTLPTLCVQCPIRNNHVQVQQNEWYAYDSDNLITLANKPAIIHSISIQAEGHTFESFVAEVELLAGD
jgi:hypothetical protein